CQEWVAPEPSKFTEPRQYGSRRNWNGRDDYYLMPPSPGNGPVEWLSPEFDFAPDRMRYGRSETFAPVETEHGDPHGGQSAVPTIWDTAQQLNGETRCSRQRRVQVAPGEYRERITPPGRALYVEWVGA